MSTEDRRGPNDADGAPHERASAARSFTPPPAPDRPPSAGPGTGPGPAGTGPADSQDPVQDETTSAAPDAWRGPPFEPQPQMRPRRKRSKAPLFLGLGVAAALIVGIILIVSALTGTDDTAPQLTADSNGVIAEDVSPFDFEQGQCFTDFSDATQPATVVTCETPHQAQLVSTFSYEDDAEFPGEEALADRADELCRDTQLSEDANQYEERLRQQTAYPQPESWQAGDRRVDCFIRITSGDITGSLIG